MALPLVAAGGSGALAAGAAGGGMAGMGAAAAALGPVGWGLLAVSAFSTVMGMSAASKQAAYEKYQLRLAERQGQIDAFNTVLDLTRDFRYTRGSAMASLGYGAAGIGESFIAVRTDELNLLNRDVRNARLSHLAGQAPIAARTAQAAARARNERTMGYLSLVQQGMRGYMVGTRLAGPGED
jgi:hypothetical protein